MIFDAAYIIGATNTCQFTHRIGLFNGDTTPAI